MKLYVYFIGALLFCSHTKATSPGCFTDEEVLKRNSLENRGKFNLSITKGNYSTDVAVDVSAPKEIDGVKLKSITAYGLRSDGNLIYLVTVNSTLKNHRFIAGYAISNDLIDSSYVQLAYEKCEMVFTYPLAHIAQKLDEK